MVKMEMGIDYVRGANIAGFVKIAEAMMAQGVV
jgi:glutamate dehydrogenase/leucine dehydrogenase